PVQNAAYQVVRRPAPGNSQSIIGLGVGVSLSASTLLVNPLSGNVDLMINPDGTVDLSGPYATPTAVSLLQSWSTFVLQDASGNQRVLTLWKTGRMAVNINGLGTPLALP